MVGSQIKLWQGDITTLAVDAIVNAANSALSGGGGVDGAIHRAAGPDLVVASRALGPLPAGQAVITPGFWLPARHVIFTVGPVWDNGTRNEVETLRNCYRNCLNLAQLNGLRSIAFPSISTGAYRFPFDEATRIAFQSTHEFFLESGTEIEVIFVFFSDKDFQRANAIWKANNL